LRLVAAFRVLPLLPVFGTSRMLLTAAGGQNTMAEVLDWALLLKADPNGQRYLWSWARCRATKSSFGAFCREMSWARGTAEDGRRRAACTIVTALLTDHKSTVSGSKHTFANLPASAA
jgi:hypothetical protein